VTDELNSLLAPLRDDVDRLALAPAMGIRDRGDRRRRHHRLATAATVTAVVAGAVAASALWVGPPGGVAHTAGTLPRPAPTGPSRTSASPVPDPSPSATGAALAGTAPRVFPTGVGPRYFLPSAQWSSTVLGEVNGDRLGEPEGSVGAHTCDRDTIDRGGVGLAGYRTKSRFVGRQKIHKLASSSAMEQAITQARHDLARGGCAQLVAATAPNLQAVTSTLGEHSTADGGYLLVRVDLTTKDGAPPGTEWVAFGWSGRLRMVWTVVLTAPLDRAVGDHEVLRLADLASAQLAAQPG
jgi:hypothetical protein